MSEESHKPHWEKLSGTVKYILQRAEELAHRVKADKVNSIHIMLTLVRDDPETVEEVIQSHSAREIENKMRGLFISSKRQVGQETVIKRALNIAEQLGDKMVGLIHLAMSAAEYCGFNVGAPTEENTSTTTTNSTPTLEKYGRDLTTMAAEKKLHPIIGRDEEIDLVAETLCRVFKRNPLLVGAAGVGKTAVVEGLALCIASGNITKALRGKRIIELTMGALVAGTKFRGMFEERLMRIIKEASSPNIILFIDELHSIIGAGIAEGTPLDASTILLPALARGDIACIGATTNSNYHRYIEKNKALERRFQPIRIPELDPEATEDVLRKLGPIKFEQTHDLHIEEEVYAEVVDLAGRYMRNRYFPDKAIDILDHAVGKAVSKDRKKVTVDNIHNVIGSLTGLPVGKLEDELRNRLEGLSSFLKSRILGQDHIIDLVVDIIWPKTQGTDLRPERPNGVFLFVGPTGVGKTEFARALTEYLFGSQDKLIRIDMSEYSESHTVSKLLGAPFGYIGFEEGSPILNEIAEKPFSVLLLDEIEKAHPDMHRLLLQVFDSGVLTDVHRRHTFFSDVIIIMTSNILIEQNQDIGFLTQEIETEARDQLVKYFAPEFVNRIDFVGVFNRLSTEIVQRIVEERIVLLLKEKWQKKGIDLEVTPEAVMLLVKKGYSEKWGARNLERTVDELISTRLARFVPKAKSKKGIKIRVTVKEGSLQYNQI